MDTILQRFGDEGEGPKYRAVAGAIRGAIAAEEMAPGDKVPPVRELAWTLGITPGTVARAYTILTEEGALNAEVGRGTFVADPAARIEPLEPPRQIRWQQCSVPEVTDQVSLFSPKLPDMGQVQMIREALTCLSERPAADLLNYPSRAGFLPARQAVVRWLEGTPLGPLDPEDMVLSHGGQNGISLVMQAVLRGPRPVVLLEELTYVGFRRAAELLRAEVVSVPMDEFGIVPEALESLVRQHDAQILCTSPEMHNPTGLFTPLHRRQEIAEVAQRTGLQILEDDCYRVGRSHELSYRALLPEQSWYVSSISKTITPALRIGFAVAPQGRRADLRRVAEHGFFGLAKPLADLTEGLLGHESIQEVMTRVRDELERYIQTAVNVLGAYDLVWRPDMPFLWLRLPTGWRAGSFCQAAEAQGVQIRSSDEFVLRDGFAPHAVRIAVNAQVTLESFLAALERLRGLLDNPPERISV
ncbi:PLP-dependent aminotransferase family protein [Puniceibacterium sp. IMCC21224]|uniref:aminotransferase-like domain-containing protein n=1 Tax=Puniceibacterium sp. IMCC21224 TaxID=1618204 RepID=UPI00064DA396|nr:PLP-dependent aminotransferase family protein [Puniceibacterium sp. IMCC21224]KMK67367.1 transcriptional regulator, GntR family [Puniceibacterium sp. IMCC21224]